MSAMACFRQVCGPFDTRSVLLSFRGAHSNGQKTVNITAGIRISADDVAVGDAVRKSIRTAREIYQDALSIPDEKTMLVSIRSVDITNHIADRVHAAEKNVPVAGTANRLVNPATPQEALARRADRVAAHDVLSNDHSGECRSGPGESNRTESAMLEQIAVQHALAVEVDSHNVIVIADAESDRGGRGTRLVNRSEHAWTRQKAVSLAVASGVASADLVVNVDPCHIGRGGAGNINRLEMRSVQQKSMLDSVRAEVASYDLASDVDGSGLGVGSAGEIK